MALFLVQWFYKSFIPYDQENTYTLSDGTDY